MKPDFRFILLISIMIFLPLAWLEPPVATQAAPALTVPAPVLKWQRGGCYSSWCETSWYASPAVADLDNNGAMEVIGGLYTIFILNGANGAVQHSIDTPGSRVWPGIVVADLEGDGDLEIVTAQGDGYLNVLDLEHPGDIVWTQRPVTNELRGLSVYDLDNDGSLEIVVTAARGNAVNTWVYEHTGSLRPGWPQLSNDSGYAWGVYNANAALGDLDGDDLGELVVPSDVHYINAYEANGTQIPAHSMYGAKGWGKVGVWESLATELRGWGYCNGVRAESYRTNFADGPAVIADVNGDGQMEVVVTGNVYDCHAGYPPSRYIGVYIFNADRSRFNTGGYDWRSVPIDTGAPLVENYNVIESVAPNPVTADLDGDGRLEILFASYDGRLHAFWLDKSEHGSWPYEVYTSGAYRFASEPVVADLDDDGLAEVIFASWVQKGSGLTGKLHLVDYLGNNLHEIDLPPAFGSPTWNGALAAPTLANIDSDADLELVLNTAHSGLVAYDLPGTANARILWGTGRGNYQRTGSFLQGTLFSSTKSVQPALPEAGEVLTYTIQLKNPGPDLPHVVMTDTLPAGLHYLDNLWASAGSYGQSGGVITWTGAVAGGSPVTITFNATVDAGMTAPQAIVNVAWLNDGQGNIEPRQATVIVNGLATYLPVVVK